MVYFFVVGTLALVVIELPTGKHVYPDAPNCPQGRPQKEHALGVVCDTLPKNQPLHLVVGLSDALAKPNLTIVDFAHPTSTNFRTFS